MKLARIALATLFVCLVVPAPVSAHSGIQSYVYMSLFDDGVEGRVEYPIGDIAEAIGIELPDAQSTIDDLSEADLAAVVDYTRDHLEIGDDDGLWKLQFDGTVSYIPAAGGYVLVPFEVVEDFNEPPRRWTVTYDGVIESKPERDALFLIEDDWRSATFRNEGEHLLGFSIGNETQTIDLESASTAESVREVAWLGTVPVEKSAIGLAAIVGVLVASVFARVQRRTVDEMRVPGVPGWRSLVAEAATRIGIVVVGLTISLWIVGRTGVDIGSRLLMVAGALGVLVAAATWWARETTARGGALVVGLLGGLAVGDSFVGQLLDRSAPIRSLIAFSTGAAVMVAVTAALLLPMMLIVRHSRSAALAGAVGVAVVVGGGLVWLVESALGLKFPLGWAEIRVAKAITSPLVVVVTTIVLGLAVLWDQSRPQPESTSVPDGSPTDPSEPIEVR